MRLIVVAACVVCAACATAPRRHPCGTADAHTRAEREQAARLADELILAARAQDTAQADRFITLLADPAAEVRAAAAFALGQLGVAWTPIDPAVRLRVVIALIERAGSEGSTQVQERVFEALGKFGGPEVVIMVLQLLGKWDVPRAAIALGVIAKLKGAAWFPAGAVARAGRLLEMSDAEHWFAGAYALMRSQLPSARPLLLRCLERHHDAVVRATCVRGLGDVGEAADASVLASLLAESDIRVAAEAGRALAKLSLRCDPGKPCAAIAALAAAGHQRGAVLEAIVFEPITHPDAAALFRRWADTYAAAAAPDARSRALLSCKAAMAHDRVLGRVALSERCGPLAARALGQSRAPAAQRLAPLVSLARDASPVVRAAAAEALGKIDVPSVLRDSTLLPLLADPDPGVVLAAAEAAAALKLSAAEPALSSLWQQHQSPSAEWLEAAQSVHAALEALGAEPGAPPPPPAGRHFVGELPDAPRVRLETTRGTIVIQLFSRDAPNTVRSFLSLVRRRFYDGLSFHRVVPGFVSQGGDPRGDGNGGPGYVIPCEISARRYRAGSVGMALSGKDTGGSQFFIAHTPQPHLDGRYTLFGEVIEGLEVALSMIEGEQMVRAVVER